MDISVFLEPVSEKCFSKVYRPGKQTLGETITIYRKEDDFPDLEGVDLAIVGVKEERGAVDNKGCADGVDHIRKALYPLFDHWPQLHIIDIGNVRLGKELNDTYFAFNQVLTELMKSKIVPIVIGRDKTSPTRCTKCMSRRANSSTSPLSIPCSTSATTKKPSTRTLI